MPQSDRRLPPFPQQVIRDLAYKLWQQAGEPHGRDVDFWLEAERQLEQTNGNGRHGGECVGRD